MRFIKFSHSRTDFSYAMQAISQNPLPRSFYQILAAVFLLITLGVGVAFAAPSRFPPKSKGMLDSKENPILLVPATEGSSGLTCLEQGNNILQGKTKKVLSKKKRPRREKFFFQTADLNAAWLKYYRWQQRKRGVSKRVIKKRAQAKLLKREAQMETDQFACRNALYRNPDQCNISITSGKITVAFQHDQTFGVTFKSISGRSPSDEEVLFRPAQYPLWRIGLLKAGDEEPEEFLIPNNEEIFRCIPDESGGSVEYRWEGRSPESGGSLTVSLKVTPNVTKRGVEFLGAIDVDEEVTGVKGVASFRFPQVVITNTNEESQLLKGLISGVAIKNPLSNAFLTDNEGGKHPISTIHPREQTIAVDALALEEKSVLVLSTQDLREQEFTPKEFVSGAVPEGVLLTVDRKLGGAFQLVDTPNAGTTVLGAVDVTSTGSRFYYDVARWYRNAKLQDFPRVKLLSFEAKQNQKELLLATLIGSNLNEGRQYADNVDYIREMEAYLGVPASRTQVLWYDWHGNPFDQDLPAHLPVQPGFTPQVVNDMKALGIQGLGLYVNPAFWANTLPSYNQLNIESRGAYVRSNGSPVTTHVGAQMDPASPVGYEWSYENVVKNILNTYQLSSAYFDVYPWVESCYSENHDHPVGGGASAWEEMVQYVEKTVSQIEANGGSPFIFSENSPETIVRDVPAYAAANIYRFLNIKQLNPLTAYAVPLYDAVYREYIPIASSIIVDMPGLDCSFGFCLQESKDIFRDFGLTDGIDFVLGVLMKESMYSFVHGHLPILVHRPIPDTVDGVTRLKDDAFLSIIVESLKSYLLLLKHPVLRSFLHGGQAAPPVEEVNIATSIVPIVGQLFAEDPNALPRVYVNALFNHVSDVAITFGNWTKDEEMVSVEIDPVRYGLSDEGTALNGVWEVIMYTPDPANGTVTETVLAPNLSEDLSKLQLSIPVPSRKPVAIVYRKK